MAALRVLMRGSFVAARRLAVINGAKVNVKRAFALQGIPTDEEQATGIERKTMEAMKKGLVKKTILPLYGSGCMKEMFSAVHLVEPITNLSGMNYPIK
ncbi:cytochrome c oxidase subunit 5B, mitochondrial isoform X2 [Protopterus annectens]|uniref:cytochrome c oxidase subunit 5B, mitochondrial isoform X2 n=1 Tax=Protopterus annectens TaxID=7888 RepID=UPI001CFB5C84|nr:cytochrome c oxidase subunit 5B, mitochondrial isoform X2 [Protopterus annectens]